jgi:hypothetical protein
VCCHLFTELPALHGVLLQRNKCSSSCCSCQIADDR